MSENPFFNSLFSLSALQVLIHNITDLSVKEIESKKLYYDYDSEADVLYLSFQKPQKATNTIGKGDILYRYDKDKTLVGITILGAMSLLVQAGCLSYNVIKD